MAAKQNRRLSMLQFKLEAGVLPKDFDADLVPIEDIAIEETRLVVIVYFRFSFLTMMMWCTFYSSY